MPTVYWITGAQPHRVAIVARPRGHDWLEDGIKNLQREGIEVLVSLLRPDEGVELGLQEERRCCDQRGIRFLSLPIEDRSVPDDLAARNLIDLLVNDVKLGKGVGFHCRAGIGRSSMLAALILARLGWTAETAFRAISDARGCPVPDTLEQEKWTQTLIPKLSEQGSDSTRPSV